VARRAGWPPCAIAVLALLLGACGSAPRRDSPAPSGAQRPAQQGAEPSSKPGGYYLDDGPHADPPADLDQVPDAQPRVEPIKASTTRPYTALGRSYTPMQALAPYTVTGLASWYGKRYHGQATASGEIYDMYAMTAAHPTLPIPSYARVTDIASGRSVVVRVNDRGPFHADRVIDLSYTAAYKLGILANGSALVRVESIVPQPGTQTAAVAVRSDTPATAARAASQPAAAGAAAGEAPTAAAAQAGGIYLQLGAFAALDNAQAFLRRMRIELSWLSDNSGVFAGGGLYRVQAGPYATRDAAQDAAARVVRTLDLQPLIVTR
jgi:rare lipoprotein A